MTAQTQEILSDLLSEEELSNCELVAEIYNILDEENPKCCCS